MYFMSLDNVKFRRPVVPGDQLRSKSRWSSSAGRTCRLKGVAYVDGQVVAEAEMLARVVGPVTTRDPPDAPSWIPARSWAGDVEIGPFAIVGPGVAIGDRCRIGAARDPGAQRPARPPR